MIYVDTAYVLAYSVIMLNTDLHSPQVKKRMTLQEFIRNNRGINDNADLPDEYLESIYHEIEVNEIKLKNDPVASSVLPTQKQVEAMREEMVNKTEAALRSMLRRKARLFRGQEKFYNASNFQHVRPMFQIVWMPILAALSSPMQASEDLDAVRSALEGFTAAIHIICLFDMDLERNAFVSTLSKFTMLSNIGQMRHKHIEAVKCILDIALSEGNSLESSWYDILVCISQLERFQNTTESTREDDENLRIRRRGTMTASTWSGRTNTNPPDDVANITRSQEIVIAVDKIFTMSEQLNGVIFSLHS